MSNKQQTIQNIQSKIDELKDKISDNDYLELCNEMKTLNTQQESEKWYKVNYLELQVDIIEGDDEENEQGETIIHYNYKNCVLKKDGSYNNRLPYIGSHIWIDFHESTFKGSYLDEVCATKQNGCWVKATKYIFLSAEPFKL